MSLGDMGLVIFAARLMDGASAEASAEAFV